MPGLSESQIAQKGKKSSDCIEKVAQVKLNNLDAKDREIHRFPSLWIYIVTIM
jgi:hypothetical protein